MGGQTGEIFIIVAYETIMPLNQKITIAHEPTDGAASPVARDVPAVGTLVSDNQAFKDAKKEADKIVSDARDAAVKEIEEAAEKRAAEMKEEQTEAVDEQIDRSKEDAADAEEKKREATKKRKMDAIDAMVESEKKAECSRIA